MANNTSLLKERLNNLRNDILCDIFKELQEPKNMKIVFTETEAPRFYYDGGWRDIIQLSIGFMSSNSIAFGWHDKRCSNSGTNAFVYSSQISTEILIQFHELIFNKIDMDIRLNTTKLLVIAKKVVKKNTLKS